MNILILGSDGQLGSSFKKQRYNFKDNIFFTNKSIIDVMNILLLRNFIIKNNIQVIINCSAYTNVDKAEIDKVICDNINIIGLKNIIKVVNEFNLFLIHFSTDYIFDGKFNKPILENAKTNPINYYGNSKLNGEKLIFESKISCIILRISWLYSDFQNNFYSKIYKKIKDKEDISVVDDQISSPTNAYYLSNILINLINNRNIFKITSTEVYNFCDKGYCSKYDFVLAVCKKLNISSSGIIKIKSSSLDLIAKRPLFTPLDQSKFEQFFSIKINNWIDNLMIY